MKNIILIILLSSVQYGFSQFVSEQDLNSEMEKKNLNLKNSHLVDSIIINGKASKPYLSSIKFFNTQGKSKIKYLFNKSGDTTTTVKTLYPDNLLEIVVYENKTKSNDSVFYKYNKRKQLQHEIWKWGQDAEIDSTKLYYDKSNKLINKLKYYNKVDINSTSNKSNLNFYNSRDSLAYHYNTKDLLVEIKIYDINNKLFSEYTIEYGIKNLPKRVIRNTEDSFDDFKSILKTVVEYDYYDNNNLKFQREIYYLDEEIEQTVEWHYSKLGFVESGQMKNNNGKIIHARKITLHNNVYN